jgi:S-(hydroxymethyl)glutathione dehydrogenase/alcohol dehydrogenase
MTRRGGQAILAGIPRLDVRLTLPVFLGYVLQERTVKGCWYGSADIRRDIPRLVDLYQNGQLQVDELISRRIGLDGVNDALAAMKAGEVSRSVIVY